jgi:hypothetical protein
LTALCCYGQTAQPPATSEELKYLRFLLMQMGSAGHHPNAKAAFENNLIRQFGLNNQEAAVIRAAGQELQVVLQQLRPAVRAIVPDSTGRLSAWDKATLAALTAQREQKVEALANRILSQVRPQTASRLRLPGRILAQRGDPAR